MRSAPRFDVGAPERARRVSLKPREIWFIAAVIVAWLAG